MADERIGSSWRLLPSCWRSSPRCTSPPGRLFLTSRVSRGELARLRRRERDASASPISRSRPASETCRRDSPTPRTGPASSPSSPASRTSATSSEGGRRRRPPIRAAADIDAAANSQRSRAAPVPRPALDRVEPASATTCELISSTPAIAPVRGIVTSAFGYRRDPITGQRAYHSGIDISAPPGKPVKSTADRRRHQDRAVRRPRPRGVRRPRFRHHHGLRPPLPHQRPPGQRVERGDIVGLVGNTGRATGYHLHYEVQVNGKPANPLAYILDSGRRRTLKPDRSPDRTPAASSGTARRAARSAGAAWRLCWNRRFAAAFSAADAFLRRNPAC